MWQRRDRVDQLTMNAHRVDGRDCDRVIAVLPPERTLMANGGAGLGVIRRLVDTAWSANVASADPDDPLVRGFADFGLPPIHRSQRRISFAIWRRGGTTYGSLRIVPSWTARCSGRFRPCSQRWPDALTPVTLWDLTAFIDALVCFDRLYCVADPVIPARFQPVTRCGRADGHPRPRRWDARRRLAGRPGSVGVRDAKPARASRTPRRLRPGSAGSGGRVARRTRLGLPEPRIV